MLLYAWTDCILQLPLVLLIDEDMKEQEGCYVTVENHVFVRAGPKMNDQSLMFSKIKLSESKSLTILAQYLYM